jgi:hypothetical protein
MLASAASADTLWHDKAGNAVADPLAVRGVG